MKPAAFDLHAPTTIDEALGLLGSLGEDAKPLAGGQSLVPLMALRLAVFGHLVDLGGIAELQAIERQNGTLVIGAGVRQRVLERDPVVARDAPLVQAATGYIGHFQIRNRGTIGGSIAHADPAAEYPAVALALDAQLDIAGPGGRRAIAADELFAAAYSTTLEPDELLVGVRVPVRRAGEGFAVHEVARRHGDFALVGCAVRVATAAGGAVQDARVVLFGVAGRPVRAAAAERALVAGDDVHVALAGDAAGLEPPGDALATSRYRRTIAPHVAGLAIAGALEDARASAEGS